MMKKLMNTVVDSISINNPEGGKQLILRMSMSWKKIQLYRSKSIMVMLAVTIFNNVAKK